MAKFDRSVLNLPELKVSLHDTHWLSHEKCVRAAKMCYSANVFTSIGVNVSVH